MRLDPSKPVLVVDDSSAATEIVCRILKQLGYTNIEAVHDCNVALARLREDRHPMVIADWNMEPMSGYDLLKEVRSDERLAGIRFIMISAESSIPHVVAARKAHADSYLVKPFSAQSLKARVNDCVLPSV